MIILWLGVGWLGGIFINWAADFLPRYSTSVPVRRSDSAHRIAPALLRFFLALMTRTDWAHLPQSFWLNLGVELFTAMVFVYLWSQPIPPFALILLTLLCSFLILVAVIDLRFHLVLNVMVLPAMALTSLLHYAVLGTNMIVVLIGGAFGFAIFALAAFVRPGQLGGGDVKLATVIGLVFGFPVALWALMIGVFVGGIVSIALLLSHRSNAQSRIPYAPFLSIGALIALVYNPVYAIFYPFIGH